MSRKALQFRTAAAVLLMSVLTACPAPNEAQRAGHPNLIIVREFSFSTGAVTLDPSFGFSLHRGQSGVPLRERAASVARAAAFNVADTIAQRLAGVGYDVVRSDTAAAEPTGRALIVSGRFRNINEGHRRRVGAENASLAVEVDIEQQNGASTPQRLTSFPVDSRRIGSGGLTAVSAPRGANLSSAAARVGGAIANTVAETARLNNWPATPH